MISFFSKCARHAWNILNNLFVTLLRYQLTYIVETANWSISEDGKILTRCLNKNHTIKSRVSTTPFGLRNQIIHFGSVNTFFTKTGWHKPHPSNKIILTWFHVIPNDPRLMLLKQAQKDVDKIHTSCQKTKHDLIAAGIDENKIVVIPLGVDTSLFQPATPEQKLEIRQRLGIDPNRLVIGSFQKDGVGWGEGLEPKLIKGPDLFVETLSKLKHLNPLVLLTGPARGYVKHGLEQHGIEYKHFYLKTIAELPEMYQALDLYLITSRLEGGPKALLEAWASGIPVVSTPVGMVPDVGQDDESVFMTENEDIDSLSQKALELLLDELKRHTLSTLAAQRVSQYDWSTTSQRYFHELYQHP